MVLPLSILLFDEKAEQSRRFTMLTALACFSGIKAINLKQFRYVALEAPSLLDSLEGSNKYFDQYAHSDLC